MKSLGKIKNYSTSILSPPSHKCSGEYTRRFSCCHWYRKQWWEALIQANITFFWWAWVLSSVLHSWKHLALYHLSYLFSPFLFLLFWKWRSHELFLQDGLKLWSTWSQPPKKLDLQIWDTHISWIILLFKISWILRIFL
jgi:hypothetical protein